jgi:hypothetical protein
MWQIEADMKPVLEGKSSSSDQKTVLKKGELLDLENQESG